MLHYTGVPRIAETYSGTRHLALSLFGRDLSDAWMVMVSGLTAYFDVSGHYSQDHRAFACAGFAAPIEEWTDGFEPRWREVLGHVGIPELHMTDVWKAVQEGSMSGYNYALLMNTLHDLLKTYASNSFARIIDGEDLDKIVSDGDYPIRVAGVDIMDAVERWRDNRKKKGKKVGPKARVRVVFDDGEADFGTLVDAMPSGRKPIPDTSLDILPLQAADWLAWELSRLHYTHKKHKQHKAGVRFKPVRIRGPVWAAIRHMPKDWKFYYKGEWINIMMSTKEAEEHILRVSGNG